MHYCEEDCECRRVQLLSHFGERFDRAACRAGCDNCARNEGRVISYQDMSDVAMKGYLGVGGLLCVVRFVV